MIIARFVILAALLSFSSAALAKTRVFACEPEWAALAVEIGGDAVDVYSATSHAQDPHFIQARPALLAKARRADLLICSGAGLEAGWLPILLRKAGGKQVQPGADGYFMAADHVDLLEKPISIDRSLGDVHAAGNPHLHLNPQRMLQIGDLIRDRLSMIAPASAARFSSNHANFVGSLNSMLQQQSEKIAAIRGRKIVVHHNSWAYLAEWLSLQHMATIEPKPGVPPSSSYLSNLVQSLESTSVDYIILSNYQNPRAAKWLSHRINSPLKVIQYSPIEWQMQGELVKWYQDIIESLNTSVEGTD